jgi:hypothetical protein
MTTLKGEGELIFGESVQANGTLRFTFPAVLLSLTLASFWHCAEQVSVPPRGLSTWEETQRKSYKRVAARYQQEIAAYYTLLALGVVGAVKLEEFKSGLKCVPALGTGVAL